MSTKRHLHIYFSIETSHRRGFQKYQPTPPVSYSKDRQAKWVEEWQTEKSLEQLHCIHIQRLEALVFDFESPEFESLYAVPPESAKEVRFSLNRDGGISVGASFFVKLNALVSSKGFANLYGDNISYRSSRGSFDRHLLRIEAMRNRDGQVLKTVNPVLFLKLNSFDWGTVLGPESSGNREALIEQMKLQGEQNDNVLADLQTTVNVFSRMGVCPKIAVK